MITAIVFIYVSSKFSKPKPNNLDNKKYENNVARDESINDFEKKAKINEKEDDIENKNENNSGGINNYYLENTQELLKEFSVNDSLKIEESILDIFKKQKSKVFECKLKENSLTKLEENKYKVIVINNQKEFNISIFQDKEKSIFECKII